MGFVVQEFSTHLCSHVCWGRCQNSSDPLGIVCTLMKITSLHRFTLLWFQKQTNWANLLSRLIVYTISVCKAFEVGVYNVSWYSSDKFLEYAWSHQRQEVCISLCVCLSGPGGWCWDKCASQRTAEQSNACPLPQHMPHCHWAPWREMSQQMTRAELLTAGTRELLAKTLQQYVAVL